MRRKNNNYREDSWETSYNWSPSSVACSVIVCWVKASKNLVLWNKHTKWTQKYSTEIWLMIKSHFSKICAMLKSVRNRREALITIQTLDRTRPTYTMATHSAMNKRRSTSSRESEKWPLSKFLKMVCASAWNCKLLILPVCTSSRGSTRRRKTIIWYCSSSAAKTIAIRRLGFKRLLTSLKKSRDPTSIWLRFRVYFWRQNSTSRIFTSLRSRTSKDAAEAGMAGMSLWTWRGISSSTALIGTPIWRHHIISAIAYKAWAACSGPILTQNTVKICIWKIMMKKGTYIALRWFYFWFNIENI